MSIELHITGLSAPVCSESKLEQGTVVAKGHRVPLAEEHHLIGLRSIVNAIMSSRKNSEASKSTFLLGCFT